MWFSLPDFVGAGFYRTLMPWERRAYSGHLKRLSPEDRRMRFMGGVSDEAIERHARNTLSSSRTRVIGWFHDGELRGAVEMVRAASRSDPIDTAFSVERLHRQRGIGTQLGRRALRYAGNHGFGALQVMTSADNAAMRRLGRRLGASLSVRDGVLEGTIPCKRPNPISVGQEVGEEQLAYLVGAVRALSPWRRAPTRDA